ncbi:MAG: hypothetical protein IPM45_15615 [Acidimicrobiales bacterium]|nr:hypothetical protein [Acidimicrobiales bacterium]
MTAPAHRVPPPCSAAGCTRPGTLRLVVGATTVARFCHLHAVAGTRHAVAELDRLDRLHHDAVSRDTSHDREDERAQK